MKKDAKVKSLLKRTCSHGTIAKGSYDKLKKYQVVMDQKKVTQWMNLLRGNVRTENGEWHMMKIFCADVNIQLMMVKRYLMDKSKVKMES